MIDPNTAIGAVGEGAKGIGKLAELVKTIFGPNVTKRQADADKYAADVKMQQIRDNPDMLISFENGNTNIKAKSDIELFERAEHRRQIEEIRQEQNIETIIEIAANQLHDDDVSDEPIEEDWIYRFFNTIKDITSHKMQLIWGKILAGEIKTPGSFSLRTLDIVRNMSQKEAETYRLVMPLILFGMGNGEIEGFIIQDNTILAKYGINLNDINRLRESGLLVSSELSFSFGSDGIQLYNSKYCIMSNSNSTIKSSIGVFVLTRAAHEIYNVLEVEPNYEYVKDVSLLMCRKSNYTETYTIHIVKDIKGDTIQHFADPVYSTDVDNINSKIKKELSLNQEK